MNQRNCLQFEEVAQDLNGKTRVELDGLAYAYLTPSDPLFGQQWHHTNIRSQLGWDLTQGVSNTIVGVLDSGLDLASAEFQGRTLTGYDYVDDDADVTDPSDGHGTVVASLIAGSANNAAFGAGMDWSCQILPIRIFNEFGTGQFSDIVLGIDFAIAENADVINFSGGADSLDGPQSMIDAIDRAIAADVIFVNAAGNNGLFVGFPASLDQNIAVGATNRFDDKADFSSFGPELDLVAPGEGVLTIELNGVFGPHNGTSFSAPLVAGTAALMKALDPSLDQVEAEQILRDSSDDLVGDSRDTPGFDEYYGYGRLNVEIALLITANRNGGDFDRATRLQHRSKRLGFMTASNEDFFYFIVPSAGVVTAFSEGASDTFGKLYDSERMLIASNDNSGPGVNFLISQKLAAGIYYVTVEHGTIAEFVNYTYGITVKFSPDVAALGSPNIVIRDSEGNVINNNDIFNLGETLPTDPISETFTITNEGTGTLTIFSDNFGDFSNPDFSVAESLPASLPAGDSFDFTVVFTPSGPTGPASQTIEILQSDPEDGVFRVEMTANVVTTIAAFREFYFGTTENSGEAANDFDKDGDGFVNLMEHAFGTDPCDPASAPSLDSRFVTPQYATLGFPFVNSEQFLQLSISKPASVDPAIVYLPMISSDMKEWIPGEEQVEISEDSLQFHFRDENPIGASSARYLKVSVETQED